MTVKVDQPNHVLGTADIVTLTWVELNPSSRTFQAGIDISKINATGTWAVGGEVSAEFECLHLEGAGSCDAQSSSPSTFVPVGLGVAGTWDATSVGTGLDRSTVHFKLQFRYAPTSVDYARISSSQPTDVRCDSETYVRGAAPGCVNYYVDAWLTSYDTLDPSHGITATHIKNAQASLPDHWAQRTIAGTNPDGRILLGPSGTALTRMYDEPVRQLNRSVACAGFVANGPDDSCDEFPFASTYQGASFIPDPARRSVAHVPGLDNSAAGSFLNAQLYSKQRVLDGEHFWITVDGPPGIH